MIENNAVYQSDALLTCSMGKKCPTILYTAQLDFFSSGSTNSEGAQFSQDLSEHLAVLSLKVFTSVRCQSG